MGLRHEKLEVYRLSMKQKVSNEKRNGTVLPPCSRYVFADFDSDSESRSR